MKFKTHSNLRNCHAILGASQYSWLRYDENRLREVLANAIAAEEGTKIHDFAAKCIERKVMLADKQETLNMYVNDAIILGMTPEVVLFHSENWFGTADAILYDEDMHILRIHDLKTGTHKAKFDQLKIYEALFCLDYDVSPFDIDCEFRIYQNNEVRTELANPEEIQKIIEKGLMFDSIIFETKHSEE